MLRVALTGGIATGKSYCLAQFASLGVPVIDADRLSRDAVERGSRALAAIVTRFGGSMLLVSLFLASSAFAQELAPQYKLMDGVRQMVKQGKSLDETKKN